MWRVLDSIHSQGLRQIASARAAARARAWAAGAAPDEVVIDIDGTLLDAHSDKQDATPTYKRGFGFYPILAYLDATGEGLAGLLRPGRAGSNDAADHLTVLDAALAQLPVTPADTDIVVRTDSAGATHGFIDGCGDRGVGFLVGLPVDAAVRDAFMLVQEEDWIEAVEADGTVRDGAWLVELTDLIDHHWGDDVRVIARRERPHPGAQLTLFDTAEGFRHQVFITDQTDADIAALELRHRHRAHVENRIRAAKDTGLRNLPCDDFVRNQAWLQLVLIAQDLHAWTQALCFDGDLAVAEPKEAASPRLARRRRDRPHRPPDHRPLPAVMAMDDRHRHRLPTPARRPPRLTRPAACTRHHPHRARPRTGPRRAINTDRPQQRQRPRDQHRHPSTAEPKRPARTRPPTPIERSGLTGGGTWFSVAPSATRPAIHADRPVSPLEERETATANRLPE